MILGLGVLRLNKNNNMRNKDQNKGRCYNSNRYYPHPVAGTGTGTLINLPLGWEHRNPLPGFFFSL